MVRFAHPRGLRGRAQTGELQAFCVAYNRESAWAIFDGGIYETAGVVAKAVSYRRQLLFGFAGVSQAPSEGFRCPAFEPVLRAPKNLIRTHIKTCALTPLDRG